VVPAREKWHGPAGDDLVLFSRRGLFLFRTVRNITKLLIIKD
jgi:hypothetical protein